MPWTLRCERCGEMIEDKEEFLEVEVLLNDRNDRSKAHVHLDCLEK